MVYFDLIEVRTLIRQEYYIMQTKALLPKLILESCMPLHATRRMALESMVWAAIECRTLTVTALGRALGNTCLEKHAIKCADRLLSNRSLQAECEGQCMRFIHTIVLYNNQRIIRLNHGVFRISIYMEILVQGYIKTARISYM
jgi:hypothetical protein